MKPGDHETMNQLPKVGKKSEQLFQPDVVLVFISIFSYLWPVTNEKRSPLWIQQPIRK
jgi:hypothetical protein